MIELKTKGELELIREAGRIVGESLKLIVNYIKPGVTTRELDGIIAGYIKENNAECAFFGYHGFPGNTCISINEEVVHGIPGDRILVEGDIVSIDVGVLKSGYYADSAYTYPVGKITRDREKLINITRSSLEAGISQARAGNRLGDVSHAVQSAAEANGLSVIRQYVGHGIGRAMHEEPQIPNFGPPGQGVELKPGMVLAIEPMTAIGNYEVEVLADQWTVVTKDSSDSAHFEHTIAVTKDKPIVLTRE